MKKKYLATKNNYLKIQKTIKEFKKGQILLEEKELFLKRKIESYKKEQKQIQSETEQKINEAEEILKKAIVDIGFDDLIDISNAIKYDNTIKIKYLSLVGVEIPSIISDELQVKINYGLYHTTADVDKSIVKYMELKNYLLKLTEIDNIIIRLQKAIEKVRRRANYLKEVVIPKNEELAKKINIVLEETERDEFVRLKVIKSKQ